MMVPVTGVLSIEGVIAEIASACDAQATDVARLVSLQLAGSET